MSEIFRSLYSVIPASVRDDADLRSTAKLLYMELAGLAQAEGFCWAGNAHLAETIQKNEKTVESLLKQLEDRGHIRREVERKGTNQTVGIRKIWLMDPMCTGVKVPLKNKGSYPQKRGKATLKNEDSHIIELNHTNTPPNPQGKNGATSLPVWAPERFNSFWEFYRTHGRGEDRIGAAKAWDKLKPDEELITTMARGLAAQVRGEQWRRKIGIPYAATWINRRRWEDEVFVQSDDGAQAEGGSLPEIRFGVD